MRGLSAAFLLLSIALSGCGNDDGEGGSGYVAGPPEGIAATHGAAAAHEGSPGDLPGAPRSPISTGSDAIPRGSP